MSARPDCDYVGKFGSIIKLNVGGQGFTTTPQTLAKDPNSMLAAMFSGMFEMQPSEDGAFFIDRDGTHFRFILNYLRTGKLTLPEGATFLKELEEEAEFYQIQGMIHALRPPKHSVPLDLPIGNIFDESIILMPNNSIAGAPSPSESEEYRRALKSWLPPDLQQVEWGLLFRASQGGFYASRFHSKCDNKGPTVVIVKSRDTNEIFGGFTEVSWTSRGGYETCSQAFLFSMNCGIGLGPTKMPLTKNQGQWGIYCHGSYGPTFGNGDLHIAGRIAGRHNGTNVFRVVGSTYECPPAQGGALQARGNTSGYFFISECEVFGQTSLQR